MKWLKRISLALLVIVGVGMAALAFTISRTEPCGPPPVNEVQGDSMRAVSYRCYGSPEILEVARLPRPTPVADEVLVRVHAAAVNPYDWHHMRGSPYFLRLMTGLGKPTDTRLGVDFAGVVEAVGPDVTRYRPGDAIFGAARGAFADYVVVGEDRAVTHKPDNVSFAEAAAIGMAGVTALQALRDDFQLQPGQKVLINGASGGVGSFAVQIARAMGAEVYGVCSTRNVERVKALGATRVFDYKNEDYTESGEQFDLILDMVGNRSLWENRRVLKPDGSLLLVGGAKGDWIGPLLGPISVAIYSPFIEQGFDTVMARFSLERIEALAQLMSSGDVRPLIDRHYPLEAVAEAISYSETGRARGKIILDVVQP